MERSNFSLRIPPSLMKAAQRLAERDNVSVNQLIVIAIAEKIAVLEAPMWAERKRKAMTAAAEGKAPIMLGEKGGNEPPREGDEMPEESVARSSKPKVMHAR